MLITHEREKLINAIIYFGKHTKYLGITKLMKLLYYFDFIHFKQTGKSVTGLEYSALPKGPVPTSLWSEFKELPRHDDLNKSVAKLQVSEDFELIKGKKSFDGKHFSKREMKILEMVAFLFNELRANQISECSHMENNPWDRTIKEKGRNKKIDYMLALDNEGALDKETVLERQKELEEIRLISK